MIQVPFKFKSLLLMLCLTFGVGNAAADEVTDVLNRSWYGLGSGYKTLTNQDAPTSGAGYSGYFKATDFPYPQGVIGGFVMAMDKDDKAGIVTTRYGGSHVFSNVKSIAVDWNSNTKSIRTLFVYGKNTPYTSADDLYDTEKQGTYLGSFTCGDGSADTLLVSQDADYLFVGIRPENKTGICYLNSVSITWWDSMHAKAEIDNDTIFVGQTANVMVQPTYGIIDGNGYPCTLKSSNPSVVSVSGQTVTGVSSGDAVITVQWDRITILHTLAGSQQIKIHVNGDTDPGGNTDVLDAAWSGLSGTTYTTFSKKGIATTAVYAANIAGGKNSLQMRSKNSDSGIVVRESAGKVKSISVVWNSNTADGRVLSVYGKNTPYTAATNLYTSNQGDLLGELAYSDGDQTLTLTGDYRYIGFRSKSGALYLDAVRIVWDKDTDPSDVNEDGKVDKGDVETLARLIVRGSTGVHVSQGDVNQDGRLTLADLTALINRLK